MTLAIGIPFKEELILIGYDGRDSSPLIPKIVCATLNSIGLDCNNAVLVPTHCLEYVIKTLGYAGGIMITTSHNPPQYNGIEPSAKDGIEISREDEIIIESIYLDKTWIKNPTRLGKTRKETKAIQAYIDGVISQVDSKNIQSKKFKIIVKACGITFPYNFFLR